MARATHLRRSLTDEIKANADDHPDVGGGSDGGSGAVANGGKGSGA